MRKNKNIETRGGIIRKGGIPVPPPISKSENDNSNKTQNK